MLNAPGIGSGLDINGIVSKLMELERRPVVALEKRQIEFQSQITAYGQLKASLSSFQSALGGVSDPDSFGRLSVTSSDKEVVSATASKEAVPGTYQVRVNRLAEAHKLGSAEYSSSDVFGGNAGDQLTLQLGSDASRSMSVDLSTASTLDEIRAAIMSDPDNPGIRATVITGNGGKQKLVLTSSETGQAGAITLGYAGTVDPGTFDFQTINSGGNDLSLLDSEVVIDGYVVNRSGNTLDDVIQGVTLDLKKVSAGQDVQVSVEKDSDSTVRAVQDFVNAYNQLRSDIRGLRGSDLQGDGTLLLMENRLLGVMNSSPTVGAFRHLSEVGISFQKEGNLTLDTARLRETLQQDAGAVAGIFSAEDTGYAVRLDGLVDSWLASDGLLDSRTDGLNKRIDRIEDQQAAMERRLEQTEARYLKQFNSLDSLVSRLNSMSSYLSQQLAALPGAQQ